jgi:hypothetical protein
MPLKFSNMNRQEFSAILRKARKLSGVKSVDLVIKLHKTEGSISNLINDRFDSMMDKLIEFIDAINFVIVIEKDGIETAFHNSEEVQAFVLGCIDKIPSTNAQEIADKLEIGRGTYFNIKKGGSIRLSVFLKVLELNHYAIRLDAKNIPII